MSDFSTNLASFVGAELNKPLQKVNKDDLKEIIMNIDSRMTTIISMFDALTNSDIESLSSRIKDGMKDHFFLGLYTKIELQFKRMEDRKTPFAGFINTAKSFSVTFNSILRAIDDIVKTREITIMNAKLSHAAIFGMIKQADIFADYTMDLFNGVLSDVAYHNVSEITPPSEIVARKLQDRMENIVMVVNKFSAIGPASLANLVKYIAFNDDTLVDDEKKPNVKVNTGELSDQQKGFIQYGFGALSYIFRTIGQWRNVMKANSIMKARSERDWMKDRIALLQMELSGMDPNSKNYRDIVKSIDKYNKMAEELQTKIDKYEADK